MTTAGGGAVFRPAGGLDHLSRGLARTVGLPLYACCRFRRPTCFSIRIEPIAVPVTGDRAADALAATAALQAQFEAFIREAPEQWMWGIGAGISLTLRATAAPCRVAGLRIRQRARENAGARLPNFASWRSSAAIAF